MIHHEAEVAERLRDAGGEKIFVQAVEDPELGVLVMEKLEGYQSLAEWMDERDRLGLKSFKRIARQLLEGLDVLEAAGLVHSDLRPSNIMVGPGLKVKVVDFGITADEGGYVPYPDYSGWRGGHYFYTSENQLKNGPAAFVDDRHSVNVVLGELGKLVPGLQDGGVVELGTLGALDKATTVKAIQVQIERLANGDVGAELARIEKLAYSGSQGSSAEAARKDLGDYGRKGAGERPVGRAADARTVTPLPTLQGAKKRKRSSGNPRV